MAKAHSSTKHPFIAKQDKEAESHPDYKLIKTCVEYGYVSSGASAAFKIDPTDSHFAGPAFDARCANAESLLLRAAALRPVTLDGLASKAAAAKRMSDQIDSNYINAHELAFLRSVADDVCRFHQMAGGGQFHAQTCRPFGPAASTPAVSS